MSCIHVNRLVQGEKYITAGDGRVNSCIELGNPGLGESRDQFLDITNAHCAGRGISGSEGIPKLKV